MIKSVRFLFTVGKQKERKGSDTTKIGIKTHVFWQYSDPHLEPRQQLVRSHRYSSTSQEKVEPHLQVQSTEELSHLHRKVACAKPHARDAPSYVKP